MMDFGTMRRSVSTPVPNGWTVEKFERKSPAYTDCLFQARFFPRFADMQDYEGGHIYAIINGYYDLVVRFEYDDYRLVVYTTNNGVLRPSPEHEFLYSLERKQGLRA